MDKKYLGIGFVFAALDKGLKNAFRAVSNFVSSTTKGLKDVNRVGAEGTKKGGIWASLRELGKIGLLSKMTSDIGKMSEALLGSKEGADEVVHALSNQAAELKFIHSETGSVDEITNKLRGNVMKIGQAWAMGPKEVGDLYQGLRDVGFAYKELNKGVVGQNTLIDQAAKLTGIVGVSQQEVVDIFRSGQKTLKMNTEQMDDLIKSTAFYQQKFQMPDLFSQLDDVLKSVEARKLYDVLGPKETQKVTKSAMQLTAAFRQAGLSKEEATDALSNLYEKLGMSGQEFKKLRAGLDSSLSSMNEYTLITGDIGSAMDAIQSKDPAIAVARLRQAVSKVKSPRDLEILQTRLYETFGPEVTKAVFTTWKQESMDMIFQNNRLAKNTDEWAKMTGKAFDEVIEARRDTPEFAEKAAKAAEALFKTEMATIASPRIVQVRRNMAQAYKDMDDKMKNAGTTSRWFMGTLEVLRTTGIGGLLSEMKLVGPRAIMVGEAFEVFKKVALGPISMVVGGVGGLADAIVQTHKAAKLLGINLSFVGKALKWFGAVSWGATKSILGFLAGIIKTVVWIPIKTAAIWLAETAMLAWAAAVNFGLWPILAIVVGIAALVAIIYVAIKYWDVWTGWVIKASKWTWDLLKTIGAFIYKGLKPLIDFVMKIVHWFTGLSDTVLMVISVFFPFIGIPALIIKHWSGVKEFIGGIWDWVYEKIKWAIDGIMKVVDPLLGIFKSIGGAIGGAIGKLGKLVGLGGDAQAAASAAAAVPTTSQEKRDVAKAAVQARVDETAAALPPGMIPGEDRAAVLATRREATLKSLKTKPEKDVMAEMVKAIYDIGSEIVNAVQSGMSVNVELVGDAKKFIRVSSAQSNAAMMRTGAGAQIGG